MAQDHSTLVKQNFEQKAAEYDDFMQKCVPDYFEMLDILVNAIPFDSESELTICDLGSGTGNVTALLLKAFPNAKIKCVDISPTMIDMAKAKLDGPNLSFDIADFNNYVFTEKYDIIISALALHHLATDTDKKNLYQSIHNALNNGGIFYNADWVIDASESLENKNMELWKDWLRQYHSEEELMESVIDRYFEEDKPTSITNHIIWLKELGFRHVDVIWKKQKGAVFGGFK